MLLSLSVRDFVIVDRVELELSGGFTVLTGETGAGKSILMDALALVLGDRADAGVVRAGRERAEISAEFSLDDLPEVAAWLQEQDLADEPGLCLIRRVIDAGGRSRAFINGRAATLQQLREVGEQLVDIHGQHAHQLLLKPDAQRDVLDGFANAQELRRQVAAAWREWQQLRRRREEWEQDSARFAEERERLEWQCKELAALQLTPASWHDLQAEHSRLAHAASLLEGVQYAEAVLDEGDAACLPQLSGVSSRLARLAEIDPQLNEVQQLIESAAIQLQEAGHELRHYSQRLELDPAALADLESRMQAVHDAARKYRSSPEELPTLLVQTQGRLDELAQFGDAASLLAAERASQDSYMQLARQLSSQREQAARVLAEQVTAGMQQLALAGGRLEIALLPIDGNAGGLEQVEFRVASHASMDAKALAKVASGGELSRISLAIEVVTSHVKSVPTLVFDEVDVGIGGGVAEVVGKLLRNLGRERQVLCITHLPQVAACGQQQFRISKHSDASGVISQITPLSDAERADEIARMLGGVEITATTRQHAQEMLARA